MSRPPQLHRPASSPIRQKLNFRHMRSPSAISNSTGYPSCPTATPLSRNPCLEIYTPIYEEMKIDIRVKLKARRVEVKTQTDTPILDLELTCCESVFKAESSVNTPCREMHSTVKAPVESHTVTQHDGFNLLLRLAFFWRSFGLIRSLSPN
ncbi:RNA-binding KH domain-containing protein [Striga hermonthica]|uniref:RNA-binding KH domain-containing protein n=1 Tax=Striga hermonthica TaxID=68872 RepID=A0A9N7NFR7_STRHE|nr:RNA-binding KH domain-containing protein [Striga hermonthica]